MFETILTPRDVAERYHRCLPEHIRQYLKGRGIPATIIDRQLLGWNGDRITIPIFGLSGGVLGFRYAKSPDDSSDSPEVISDNDARPELYGWETLSRVPFRVVICDGEFDRLVLEARGFPAVTSTAGPGVFLEEWTQYFEPVKEVYVCFRRGGSSEDAAERVRRILPAARVAHLPSELSDHSSITDFFVGLQRAGSDFEVVLAAASGGEHDDGERPLRLLQPADKSLRQRADRLRKVVSLHEVAGLFTTLHASGRHLKGHCPLHDDRERSFTVHLDTETYRCSGCSAEGDVVTFLMDKESMTFGQALEALERFEFTHELYRID